MAVSSRFLEAVWKMPVVLLLITSFCAAATLCSFSGPDLSADSMELTAFSVSGPSDLAQGDLVTISFTLKNAGQQPINLTDKGVFAAIMDREEERRDTTGMSAGKTIAPLESVHFSKTFTLDENGVWEIWPSYEFWKTAYSPVLKHDVSFRTSGPLFWQGCELTICPDYCSGGIRYHDAYVGQENECEYSEETCADGCDDEGIACSSTIADDEAPRVSVTSSPPDPSPASMVSFTVIATDSSNVSSIKLFVNGSLAKECKPPQYFERDDYWQCTYSGGPYPAGRTTYMAEAKDQFNNRGVSVEKSFDIAPLKIPEQPVLPPEQQIPISCTIAGRLMNFSYYSKSIQVKVCQAERIQGGCSPVPPFVCTSGITRCKDNATIWYANTTRLWTEPEREGVPPGPLGYELQLPCGEYMVTPVYVEYPDVCPWQGSWNPSSQEFVNLSDIRSEGHDFTFRPLDQTQPAIRTSLEFSPAANPSNPSSHSSWVFQANAGDSSGIRNVEIEGTVRTTHFQSDENGPLESMIATGLQTVSKTCNSSLCEISVYDDSSVKDHGFDIHISACDMAGNKASMDFNRTTRPEGAGDISVLSIDPVQVLYNASLVIGKNTAFRVKVKSTFDYPQEVYLNLTLPEGEWDTEPSAGGMSVEKPVGWSYPDLWGPILIPAHADNHEIMLPIIPDWQKDGNFSPLNPSGMIPASRRSGVYWPSVRIAPKPKTDSVSYFVEIDPRNAITETNEANNRAEGRAEAVQTKNWKLCFIPVIFNLYKSYDENISSYQHYLIYQGYTDNDSRFQAVKDWESAHESGYAPLTLALSDQDISRVKNDALEYVEYFTNVYPVADNKVSYQFLDQYLYFQDDYIQRKSGSGHLCPNHRESGDDIGSYYGDQIWWFRDQMRDSVMVADNDCDFTVTLAIFGCCGQSTAGYGVDYAQIDAGMGLNGPAWTHFIWSRSDYEYGTPLSVCQNWSYGFGGAADTTLAHEANHAELDFQTECYGCSPEYGDGAFCGDCLGDEGFSVNYWKRYPKGEWISGNNASGSFKRFLYYNGTGYFADVVGVGWNRLGKSRLSETDSASSGYGGYLRALDVFESDSDPPAIYVRGSIYKNGSAAFEPFVMLQNATLDLPAPEGDYRIVLLDGSGNALSSFNLTESFEVYSPPSLPPVQIDIAHFAFRIGWNNNTKSIELQDKTGSVLTSRSVSANRPEVHFISPLNDAAIDSSGDYPVKWVGTDTDDDALYYSLMLSEDSGMTWAPLSLDSKNPDYLLDTSSLDGNKTYLLKAKASDGVNTAEETVRFRISGEVSQLPTGAPSETGPNAQDALAAYVELALVFAAVVVVIAALAGTIWKRKRM